MIFLSVVILALVQGITEFLPISSSGHLVLAHAVMQDDLILSAVEQKLLDVAVHIGTLMAVILYFRRDFIDLVTGGFSLLRFRAGDAKSRKALHVLVASLPVILAGFIMFQIDVTMFDSLYIMAWMTLIFGIILYIADRKPQTEKTVEDFTLRDSLIYGFSQVLALVPGVSRAGITMTAGRFLGHSRFEAARFSLLMSMVAIAGAGTLSGLSLLGRETVGNVFLTAAGLAVAISFVAAYLVIVLMMRWLKSASFAPFAVYRVLLGIVLLALLYSGAIPQNM